MNGLLIRTVLNSSCILSRIQLNSAKFIAQIKLQSTTSGSSEVLSSTVNYNPVSFKNLYSTKKDNEGGLEKKAQEIVAARNGNPFNLYLSENYKSTAQNNPNATNKEIFGILASSWRTMTFDQKLKYLETANENRRQTKAELEKFFSSLSEEEASKVKETIKKNRSDRRKELSRFRNKREKRAFQKPKSPPGAFFLYFKTLPRGDANIREFIKGASMKWKALAQQDKQKFIDENKKLEEEYQKNLAEWETRMVSEGRTNLVRRKFHQSLEKALNKKKLAARSRGLKGARALQKKRQLAKIRQQKKKFLLREKRLKSKAAAKARLAKLEIDKAKKLVAMARELKLSVLNKSLPIPAKSKPKSAKSKSKSKKDADTSGSDSD